MYKPHSNSRTILDGAFLQSICYAPAILPVSPHGEKWSETMYGLYGKMVVVPGQRDRLINLLLKSAGDMQDMEGCYLYVISKAPDEPDAIWITEVWRSQDDHRASLSNEGVKAVIAEARPLIADMPVRIEVVPVGGKGLPDTTT
jgi:quinol monooxygenase YgiN